MATIFRGTFRAVVLAVCITASSTALGAATNEHLDQTKLDFLKDLVSVFSLPVSIIALIATQRTTGAKAQREKREELKGSIEKLMEFKNIPPETYAALTTEQERENFNSLIYTRRGIYLESAEYLARSIPHVTTAEWIILGTEHMDDSNYEHAERLFECALKAARRSSAVSKATALRTLAASQMLQASGVTRGRASYQKAVDVFGSTHDPYLSYTNALTYRRWSLAEWRIGNEQQALERVFDALRVLSAIPDWFQLGQHESRQCVRLLLYRIEGALVRGDKPAAANLIDRAETALRQWDDTATQELRAQLAQLRLRLSGVASSAPGAEPGDAPAKRHSDGEMQSRTPPGAAALAS